MSRAESCVSDALWKDLDSLRNNSRLILAALEQDDLDRVQMLAQRSSILVERITSAFRDIGAGEEADGLLEEVSRMNDRIVSVLIDRRDEAREAITKTRRQRLRVMRHGAESESEPQLFDGLR